jgi:hypothetical protein
MKKEKIGILAVTLALLLFGAARLEPLIATSPTEIPLPSTSDSGACFRNINEAIPQQQGLSPAEEARLLQVAESSSQYQAFTHGAKIPPVSGTPAMEYSTTSGCSGIVVKAYTFSFVSGGQELSIGVDPNTLRVVEAFVVPAMSWGH